MKLLASVIAICLISGALGHGKEEKKVPNLGPLPSPQPKPTPEDISQEVATCYQGYTLLSDGKCVKEIVEPATPAEGDVTVPYITRCPDGFYAMEGSCVRSQDVPLAYFCPVGFADDGNSCAQTVPGETVTSCNEGELVGGACILTQRAPHIITPRCPEGSAVEKDGNCWKVVETFDCTPSTGKEPLVGRVIAPQPRTVPLGKKIIVSKGAKLRSLHGKKKAAAPVQAPRLPYSHPTKNSVPGKLVEEEQPIAVATPAPVPAPKVGCPKKEMVSVSAPRPTKVGVASQTCEKKVQVDAVAIVSCPEDFEDMGEECVREVTTPPNTLCLSNGSTTGACPPFVRRVPKYPQCPDGGNPNAFGKCIQIENAAAEHLCAEGFKDTGNGCTANVKSGGLECRPGLTLVGEKCVGKSVRPSVSLTLKAKPGCENKY